MYASTILSKREREITEEARATVLPAAEVYSIARVQTTLQNYEYRKESGNLLGLLSPSLVFSWQTSSRRFFFKIACLLMVFDYCFNPEMREGERVDLWILLECSTHHPSPLAMLAKCGPAICGEPYVVCTCH